MTRQEMQTAIEDLLVRVSVLEAHKEELASQISQVSAESSQVVGELDVVKADVEALQS